LAVGGRPGRGLHEQRAEGGLLEDAGKSGLEQHAAGAGSRRGGGCAAEGAAREEHPDLRQRRPVFDPDAPRPDRRVPRRREPDRARAGHAAVQAGRGEQGAAARGCEDSRQGPGDPELPAGGRGLGAAAGGLADSRPPGLTRWMGAVQLHATVRHANGGDTTRRFLAVFKAVETNEPPTPEHMAAMGELIREMTEAGVLLATEGCLPSAYGVRLRQADGKVTVTDGPFTGSKQA